jgi:hypothetical protein
MFAPGRSTRKLWFRVQNATGTPMLLMLRDLWTALANESPNMSEERFAKEIAAIAARRTRASRVV